MLLPREHSGHQAQKRTYAILLAKRRGSTSSSSSSDRVGAPEREESSSTSKSQDGKVPVVLLGVVVVDCGIGEWRYGGVEFCCGGDETETRRCRRGERSASSINELPSSTLSRDRIRSAAEPRSGTGARPQSPPSSKSAVERRDVSEFRGISGSLSFSLSLPDVPSLKCPADRLGHDRERRFRRIFFLPASDSFCMIKSRLLNLTLSHNSCHYSEPEVFYGAYDQEPGPERLAGASRCIATKRIKERTSLKLKLKLKFYFIHSEGRFF